MPRFDGRLAGLGNRMAEFDDRTALNGRTAEPDDETAELDGETTKIAQRTS